MVLCIWQSPMDIIMAVITPSVGTDETWNSFVSRGADTKVLGHHVQLDMEVLQAVHDLKLFVVSVRCACCVWVVVRVVCSMDCSLSHCIQASAAGCKLCHTT